MTYANFSIPGLYEHFNLNLDFIDYMLEYPERFYDNVKINAVYGNFQFCIFDGGRSFTHYQQASQEKIKMIIEAFNNRNLPIRLIYTNNQLLPEHYTDKFGNIILEIANYSDLNEVVVADNSFKDYIHNRYSNLKLISSTTKCLKNPLDAIKELEQEYYLVCLDYNLNHNFDFLNQLSNEQKEKTEFLVNAICSENCPQRKLHYKLNSEYSLNYAKPYPLSSCGITNTTTHPETKNRTHIISPQQIFETYVPAGFTNFKLEGRTFDPVELLLNYVNYMVKPEWKDESINRILHNTLRL